MSKKPVPNVPVTQRRSITSLNRAPPPKQGERRRDSKTQGTRNAEGNQPNAAEEPRRANAPPRYTTGSTSMEKTRRPDAIESEAKTSAVPGGDEAKTRISTSATDQGASRRTTGTRTSNATAQATTDAPTATQRIVIKQRLSLEEGKFLKAPPQKTGIFESVRRGSDTSEDTAAPDESRSARIGKMRQNLEARAAAGNSSPSSAFDLPPLAEGLEGSSRYSSLMVVPSESASTESMKLKSALKQGERNSSKRGIRFDESTTFVSAAKTVGVVLEKPAIVWMIGPPSVGKSTLTHYVQQELQKRQTAVNVLNWATILTKAKTSRGTIDMSDAAVVNGLLAGMIEKKKNHIDVVIMVNFPLNINQAQMFETQFRPPDLILSLTASQKALQARFADSNRKPITNQLFSSRTERYYRDVDPVLQRYKGLIVTLDAEQPVATMWERVRQVLVGMQVMHSRVSLQTDQTTPQLR